MKNFIKSIVITTAFTSSVFADNTQVQTDLSKVYSAGSEAPAVTNGPAGEQVRADIPSIYSVGNQATVRQASFRLAPGAYLISNDKINKGYDKVMFIQPNINNSENYAAIVLDRNTLEKGKGRMQILAGYPSKDGAYINFSSAEIRNGILSIGAESTSTSAPGFAIFKTGKKETPYKFKPKGSMNNGYTAEMKALESQFTLSSLPSVQEYSGRSFDERGRSHMNLLAKQLEILQDSRVEGTFAVRSLNGEFGAFSQLLVSAINYDTGRTTGDVKSVGLVTFIKRNNKEDIMLYATPISGSFDFNARVYSENEDWEDSWFSKFFVKLKKLFGWKEDDNTTPTYQPSFGWSIKD